MKAVDNGTTRNSAANNTDFPQHPGEDALAHAVQIYKEQVSARLAALGLLSVAQGEPSVEAKYIVDVDLRTLPSLPVGHRDYHRREETRTKIRTQNMANAERRFSIMMAAWTKLYALYKCSTETTAPVLSRELFELCDLSVTHGLTGGYFDGPRAHRIVMQRLTEGGRTEADKDYYRVAERLQRSSHLPDGCNAADYNRKALAFLVHIKPFLPQS